MARALFFGALVFLQKIFLNEIKKTKKVFIFPATWCIIRT